MPKEYLISGKEYEGPALKGFAFKAMIDKILIFVMQILSFNVIIIWIKLLVRSFFLKIMLVNEKLNREKSWLEIRKNLFIYYRLVYNRTFCNEIHFTTDRFIVFFCCNILIYAHHFSSFFKFRSPSQFLQLETLWVFETGTKFGRVIATAVFLLIHLPKKSDIL